MPFTPPDLCTITGHMSSLLGVASSGKELMFVLKEAFTDDNGNIGVTEFDAQVGAVKRVRSGEDGSFSVTLPQEAVVSIKIEGSAVLGYFTVPAESAVLLTAILEDADNFVNEYADLN